MAENDEQQQQREVLRDKGCEEIAFLDATDGLWHPAGIRGGEAELPGQWGIVIAKSYVGAWSAVQALDACRLVPKGISKIALFWHDSESARWVPGVNADCLRDVPVLVNLNSGFPDAVSGSGKGFVADGIEMFAVKGGSPAGADETLATNLSALVEELEWLGVKDTYEPSYNSDFFSDIRGVLSFTNGFFGTDIPDFEDEALPVRKYHLDPPEGKFFYFTGETGSIAEGIWEHRGKIVKAMEIWSAFESVSGLYFSSGPDRPAFDAGLALELLRRSGICSSCVEGAKTDDEYISAVSSAMETAGRIPDLWRTDDFGDDSPVAAPTAATMCLDSMLSECGCPVIECEVIRWPDRSEKPEMEFIPYFQGCKDVLGADAVGGEWTAMFFRAGNFPGARELIAMMATGALPASVTKGIAVLLAGDIPEGFVAGHIEELRQAGIRYVFDMTGKGDFVKGGDTDRLESVENVYGDLEYRLKDSSSVLPEVVDAFRRPCFEARLDELLFSVLPGFARDGMSAEVAQAISFGKYEIPEELCGELPCPRLTESAEYLCSLFASCYDDDMARWTRPVAKVSEMTMIWDEILYEQGLEISGTFPAGMCWDALDYMGKAYGIESALEAYLSGVPVLDVIGLDGIRNCGS